MDFVLAMSFIPKVFRKSFKFASNEPKFMILKIGLCKIMGFVMKYPCSSWVPDYYTQQLSLPGTLNLKQLKVRIKRVKQREKKYERC